MNCQEFLMPITFFLLVLLCSCAPHVIAEQDESFGLVLSAYNKVETRGCYNFNQSISLCFHIHPSFMKLMTKNGKILVLSQKLGNELFLLKMENEQFLGYESRMIAIPIDAPTSQDWLLDYWHRNHGSKHKLSNGELQLLKRNYHRALAELRKTPELLLLELVSSALAHQKHQVEALTSFHEMCRALLKKLDVQLPTEFEAVQQQRGREKRCTDMRSYLPDCLGMCGRRCSCWSWVCGDCCWHRGCYQHDLCCDRDFWSFRCLTPWFFGFRCRSYGGYPKCLS